MEVCVLCVCVCADVCVCACIRPHAGSLAHFCDTACSFRDSKFYLTQKREGSHGEEHLMVHAQDLDNAELDLGVSAVEINKARKTYGF